MWLCGSSVPNEVECPVAHLTAQREAELEEIVQGSRFIARVRPVNSVEDAMELLTESRAEHPTASHHCWAYRVGEAQRFSDDGEPGGTAGRPMLEVMLKRDLDMVAAVVVRYFGGKKLGAGGLVRAYSGAVAKALDAAGVREVVDLANLTVRAPFAQVDVVLRTVDTRLAELPDSARSEAEFDGHGLRLLLTLPSSAVAALEAELREVTSGSASVDPSIPS